MPPFGWFTDLSDRSHKGERITRLRIKGKGSTERNLGLASRLYGEIKSGFAGTTWVIGHGSRPLSRAATTN